MSIIKKRMVNKSWFGSFVKAKCPQCREGNMFTNHTYHLAKGKFVTMHDRCEQCNYRFSIEPGFFIGASYVNYAFFIVILLTTYFTGRVLFGRVEPVHIFYVVVSFVLILFPMLFRYSRVLYSYLFSGVSYDPKATKKK